MEDTYRKLLLAEMPAVSRAELREGIILLINRKEKRSAQLKGLGFGAAAFASLGCALFLIPSLVESFRTSGFFEYASLLASGSDITNYWKELGYSLLESLPFTATITFLAIICAGVFSSVKTFTTIRTYRLI